MPKLQTQDFLMILYLKYITYETGDVKAKLMSSDPCSYERNFYNCIWKPEKKNNNKTFSAKNAGGRNYTGYCGDPRPRNILL